MDMINMDSNNRINRVLIPFDMIFDTELGLLKLILTRYMDEEEFNVGMLNHPDGVLKFLLNGRASKNPLTDFVVREEDADFYYNEFIAKKYNEILEFSQDTAIAKFVKKMLPVSTLNVTAMCSTEGETIMLDEYFNEGLEYVLVDYDDLENSIDLRSYDTIYVKNIEDLYLYKQSLAGKNIYMASYLHNYTFGLQEPVPDVRVSAMLLDQSDLYTIDIYSEDEYIVVEG